MFCTLHNVYATKRSNISFAHYFIFIMWLNQSIFITIDNERNMQSSHRFKPFWHFNHQFTNSFHCSYAVPKHSLFTNYMYTTIRGFELYELIINHVVKNIGII